MDRTLAPEILDGLPANDRGARGSRRDLRKINALMRQAPVAAALVARHASRPPRRVVDLGCGDGAGALATLRRIGGGAGGEVVLLDARPVVGPETLAGFEALGWSARIIEADVFGWLAAEAAPADVILANLFVHHFEGHDLVRLLRGVAARAVLFVATEPRRSPIAHLSACAVGLIGANAVTRHDAPASVRAGFAGHEIGRDWPGRVLFERRRGPFTHAFAGQGTIA